MTSATAPSGDRQIPKKRRLTPRFWFVISGLFIAYMAVSYVTGFVQIARIKGEIRQVQAEIDAVEQHNEALREELMYLQSDEYIEKVAREQLGLVKPGETAVRVAPSQQGE